LNHAGFSCLWGILRSWRKFARDGGIPARVLLAPTRGSQPGAQAGRRALKGQGSTRGSRPSLPQYRPLRGLRLEREPKSFFRMAIGRDVKPPT